MYFVTSSGVLLAGIYFDTPGCRMKAYKKPYLNYHRELLPLHRRHDPKMVHLSSVIPANDTNKESMFGHQNFSSRRVGIEPLTSSTRGKCANH